MHATNASDTWSTKPKTEDIGALGEFCYEKFYETIRGYKVAKQGKVEQPQGADRKTGNDKNDQQTGKQVIARAAAILNCLEQSPQGLNLSQIARGTDLPRSTVQRLVAALEAQNMLSATPQGIRLGPALARLAASAHTDIIRLARQHMEALGRAMRETVDLSLERGEHAISVDQYASDQELRVVSPIGNAFPLHATAHGKALLALWPDEKIKAQYSQTMEKRTKNTITSITALIKQLDEIRKTGFSCDLEEHADGVCGIGVTINTPTIERYAISVAVPTVRYEAQLAKLKPAILRCKASIEASIGAA